MWLKTTTNYSPNFSFPKRSKIQIKFIIIHYTGMKKESSAIRRLCNSKYKVSAHYFIKKNGETLNMVPDLYEAWHAGKSSWKQFKSLNKYSIGIEVHNPGHTHNYTSFPTKQINSLKKLLKILMKNYKINYKNVLGHSDIAPERKKDPGEKFPWKILARSKLADWHGLGETQINKLRLVKIDLNDKKNFMNNLKKIGYKKTKKSSFDFEDKFIIKAFQRRFRQKLINGIIDKECLTISKNLVKI